MKKTILISIIATILMSFRFSFPPSDYRDLIIGNYASKEYYRHLNKNKIFKKDSMTYTVNVVKGNLDSLLLITTRLGTFSVKLINNNFKCARQHCFGKFSNDSIYLSYIPSNAPMTYFYQGKK